MKILLHSQHRITETVVKILAEAKKLSGVEEEMQFAPLEDGFVPPKGVPVLSLGSYQRRGQERVVQTYSGPQIVTKADSLTRLSTAFQLLHKVPELPEFKYEVVPSIAPLRKLEGKLLAVDIETRGQVDAQVPGWEHVIALSIYDGECAYVVDEELCQNSVARAALLQILSRSQIIGQNFKFDGKYIGCYPDHDTMLMHYALFPGASSHGLKDLALEYFAAEDWDTANKQFLKSATYEEYTAMEHGAYAYAGKYPANSGYERIPRHKLYLYGGWDVFWTYWLYQEFSVLLANSPDSQRVYAHLMELSHMYQRVESAGNRFDVEYMDEFAKVLTAEGKQLETELHELTGVPLNPRSPKQVKEFFASQGLRLKTTDANTMQELADQGNEVAKKILAIRGNSKMNGTYITGYRKQLIGDRGYQTYKLHAATTGRLGGGGPSMLTVPRDKRVKKMILPDVGHVVVGADASQMELRILAMESQDPWLIAAFQPEAGDFFDLIMQQAYPDLDPVKLKRDDLGAYTDLRASIKGTIYGKAFNRGDKAIATALGITLKEATKLSDAFIRPGSEFSKWRDEIERKAVTGEAIVNRFGRHFQSELVTHKNRQQVINSAMSFISQSTGNDLLLCALMEIEPKLSAYGARLMGSIHDAGYLSTPPEHAEELGEMLVEAIVSSGARIYGNTVAFVSDWAIGNNLGEV